MDYRSYKGTLGLIHKTGTVDLSLDGKRLAVMSPDAPGPVQFWDVNSGKKIGSLGTRFDAPLCFSPDGKLFAAVSGRFDIELWDLADQKMLRSWNATDAWLLSLAIFPDSRKLLSCDVLGQVHI
ncbi:MAG: WD40 repeat domain-containing protein [Gemmataceae bacterium]